MRHRAAQPGLDSAGLDSAGFNSAGSDRSGFTLLELILVMVILAIASAIIVPTLRGFAISRASASAAQQILSYARYARTQSISQGRIYRLNFDVKANDVWLTTLDENTGNYVPPPNEFGIHSALPDKMRMTVDVIPQPEIGFVVDTTTVQESTVNMSVPFGQPVAPETNPILEIQHAGGTYIEFQPSGRCDPSHVQLTDSQGRVFDLGNATSTEAMHLLSEAEMR
jgi:prepilin-type N-terminal cleavage/methylation domain-containing protein